MTVLASPGGRPVVEIPTASDAQTAFVYCSDRFTAFIGGVGSGKTYAGALKAFLHPCERGSAVGRAHV